MKKNLFLGLLIISFFALVSVAYYFSSNFSQLVSNDSSYLKVALASDRTSLTFQWQKNDDDTTYYKLYHGVRSLIYGESIQTNSNVSSLILDISKFSTFDHYFVLSAVDSYGNESEKSPEIYINLDPNALGCGNGLLDEGEICDGNYKLCEINGYVGQRPCVNDCLGWEVNCQAIGTCGDGIVNGPEVCEGSGVVNCNFNGYLGETQCNPLTCQYTGACDIGSQFCGNGQLEGWEECDGTSLPCVVGGYPGEKGCVDCLLSDACVKIPVCGDEYTDPLEECDGFGQGCTVGLYGGFSSCVNCQYSSCDIGGQACGNNILEGQEECDGNNISCYISVGNYLGERECLADCSDWGSCQSDLECGDGIVNGNEACDKNGPSQACNDPNGYEGGEQFCKNDCSGYGACSSNLSCNDGTLSSPPELCEINDNQICEINGYSGNQLCSANCLAWQTCQTTEYCGDSIKNGYEVCDKNGPNSTQPCDATSGYPGGEQSCLLNCQAWGNCETDLECGDGIITTPIEVCDTANPDQACYTTIGNYLGAKVCEVDCSDWGTCLSDLECGDGIKNGNEICDGDTVSCPLNNGYIMEKTCKNSCLGYENCEATQWCGDGDRNGLEVCDAGETQTCQTTIGNYEGIQTCNIDCLGWGECITTESCGDGIVNGNEFCDVNSYGNCIADNGESGKMPCSEFCTNYLSDMCCPEKFTYDGGPWNELLNTRNGAGYYRGVLIGDQCWMQDNLNAGIANDPVNNDGIIQKFCYNNQPANCRLYGGLYLWREAMQGSTVEGIRGACPEGWHVPTDLEFNILENYTVDYINSPNEQSLCDLTFGNYNIRCGDLNNNNSFLLKGAGISLRDESAGGDNLLKFNLLLGGEHIYGSFRRLNETTTLFTSYSVRNFRNFRNNDINRNRYISRIFNNSYTARSLRCIMDE